MKKILMFVGIIVLTGFLLLNGRSVSAQGSMMGNENTITQTQDEGNMHTESIETVLQEILDGQKVSTIGQLDLSKIGDEDWERLGDAVMEVQHPGQAHEVMDRMMGGEGSESLRQMHINMGKAYLGYGGNYGPGMTPLRQGYEGQVGGGMMGMMGMMGGNGMTPLRQGFGGQVGFGSMMGYGGNAGVYGILGSATWIALIVFLVAGAYYFIKQAGKK